MAEATSSHLDSYVHVYDNGSTARLHVTPWNRNTVADGNWQTINTIQPLINRDVYLADCIDRLAEKYTVFTEGQGISIVPNIEPEGTYTISSSEDYKNNIPNYTFDERYFTTHYEEDISATVVGIKISEDSNQYIYADSSGIHANVDYLMYSTSSFSSHIYNSANYTSAYTYKYLTANLGNTEYVTELPPNPNNSIYIIG
jgi:hypothetical protein